MRKKVKQGDVFDIKTSKGHAYFQFTLKSQEFGHLIRVLPGIFSEELRNVSEVVDQPERFFIYFPLQSALNRKLVRFVTNCEIPLRARSQPILRREGVAYDPNGRPLNWIIWDGLSERVVSKLNSRELKYSILEIWNDTILAERIASGWSPSDEK